MAKTWKKYIRKPTKKLVKNLSFQPSEDSNLSENIFEPLSNTLSQNIAKFEFRVCGETIDLLVETLKKYHYGPKYQKTAYF
jgi:hypothetical protein